MDYSIQLYLCLCFFDHAEGMASVYDEVDVKDESLFPSLECDQVCSVFFMTQTNKQIFIENSYITIHENIKSIYENSSPILGLFKKTSLGNIHRRQIPSSRSR